MFVVVCFCNCICGCAFVIVFVVVFVIVFLWLFLWLCACDCLCGCVFVIVRPWSCHCVCGCVTVVACIVVPTVIWHLWLRSGSGNWGPVVPTAIWHAHCHFWHLLLRSGSTHLGLTLAVEVPLRRRRRRRRRTRRRRALVKSNRTHLAGRELCICPSTVVQRYHNPQQVVYVDPEIKDILRGGLLVPVPSNL